MTWHRHNGDTVHNESRGQRKGTMSTLEDLLQGIQTVAPDLADSAAVKHLLEKAFESLMEKKPADDMADVGVKGLPAAVRAGDQGLVRDLLERGALINALGTIVDGVSNRGEAPIHIAVAVGQIAMVKLLIAKGADRNLKNTGGKTPLILAILGDRLDIVEALLKGAHVDRSGYLRQHAVPDGEGNEPFQYPLAWGAEKGRAEIIQKLIDHGVSVDYMHPKTGYNPAHLAADRNHANVIDVIAKAGGDLELSTTDGLTPLCNAATRLNIEATTALLRGGASISNSDNLGFTPLHNAAGMAGAEGGAAGMVELLLQWGANEGATTLHGSTAQDVVGCLVAEEKQIAEDVERVRKLLSKASAVRKAWVRRGLFVMARSRPDLLKLSYHPSNDSGAWQEIEDTCWIDVAAGVLDLEEEGIFRLVVEYL